MDNNRVIDIFQTIADILDIRGENPFKSRAYRMAAQKIKALTRDLGSHVADQTLTEIPGVGKELAEKIGELYATGDLRYLHTIQEGLPAGLLDLLDVPGIGPKTAKVLWEEAKIADLDTLEARAREGKLAGLPGISAKTQENILAGIELIRKGRERMPLGTVWADAQVLVAAIERLPGVTQASLAGSARRRRDTVKDLDIVAASTKPAQVIAAFTALPLVSEVLAHGETKAVVRLPLGIQVDFRVVEPKSYGALLCHLTGSKTHNIALRGFANKQGLTVSEYGVHRLDTGAFVAGATEEDVYRALGLPWIPPEVREDGTEIEAALHGRLPALVPWDALQGDLHMHSLASDGTCEIEDLVEACRKRGYHYLAITDHSRSLRVANGLSVERLLAQVEKVRKLNARLRRFTVLAGSECDILADGSLDYPDEVLAELDFVIGSVHSGFKVGKAAQTKRIITAMRNPHVNLIGHISGRLLGEREAYDLDYDEIFRAARDTNTAIEINSYPLRLDLADTWCRRARDEGVRVMITSDTHQLEMLDLVSFGIGVARRGWLEARDILNTLPLSRFRKEIQKH